MLLAAPDVITTAIHTSWHWPLCHISQMPNLGYILAASSSNTPPSLLQRTSPSTLIRKTNPQSESFLNTDWSTLRKSWEINKIRRETYIEKDYSTYLSLRKITVVTCEKHLEDKLCELFKKILTSPAFEDRTKKELFGCQKTKHPVFLFGSARTEINKTLERCQIAK